LFVNNHPNIHDLLDSSFVLSCFIDFIFSDFEGFSLLFFSFSSYSYLKFNFDTVDNLNHNEKYIRNDTPINTNI
jgi:hypothetical protein